MHSCCLEREREARIDSITQLGFEKKMMKEYKKRKDKRFLLCDPQRTPRRQTVVVLMPLILLSLFCRPSIKI